MRVLSLTLRRFYVILAAAVVVVLAGGVVYVAGGFGSAQVHVTAYFERTTGLYPGDNVTILGVAVGKVDSVLPQGTQVKVQFHYDGSRKVPATAKAAIVAPSLVTGRYVQLAPVYGGGPQMADGAVIPQQRTAVPVEWAQVETQLTRMATALGPNGDKDPGALRRLITSGSAAFSGQGKTFKDTLTQLSQAAGGLSDDSGNLFATVRNLDSFVGALNASGAQITTFSNQLASISTLLNNNRGQLATLTKQADQALNSMSKFVADNKNRLGTGVNSLTDVGRQLVNDQTKLANVLHLVPTTLANFYNIYDPNTGAFTGRVALPQTAGLSNTLCQSIFSLGGTLQDCQKALGPLVDELNLGNLPIPINPTQDTGSPNQKNPGQPDPPQSKGAGPAGSNGGSTPQSQPAGHGGLLGLLSGGQP